MTANRWWVRTAARWLARIDGVSGQLRLAFLFLTGVSTMSVALKSYGLGQFAGPLVGLAAVGGLAMAYLYTEGGVWNQMARDRQDLSGDYSDPGDLIGHRIGAQQLAYLGYLVQSNGEGPQEFEAIVEDMHDLTEEEWARLREGVDPEAVEQRRGEA
jgi:hypothetical protein